MIFHSDTMELYTSNGDLLKKLHCPFDFNWDELEVTSSTYRNCQVCKIHVVDTAYHNEDSLAELLKNNPNSCLRISLDQENIIIVNNDLEKR
jgi:hypothetical protein